MRLTEGVTTCDQGDGFFVVHRHAPECFTRIFGRKKRIRIAVWTFRIDIDQTHLNNTQRSFELTVFRITLITQPFLLRTPVHIFLWFPHIFTSAGKAKRLEAHRLQSAITCEDHQIGPRKLLTILLLYWPKQQTRFVEVCIVRPAVEWSEALLSRTCPPTAVCNTVRTGTMPGHPDHERTIMAIVCRPPVFGTRHEISQVFFHCI